MQVNEQINYITDLITSYKNEQNPIKKNDIADLVNKNLQQISQNQNLDPRTMESIQTAKRYWSQIQGGSDSAQNNQADKVKGVARTVYTTLYEAEGVQTLNDAKNYLKNAGLYEPEKIKNDQDAWQRLSKYPNAYVFRDSSDKKGLTLVMPKEKYAVTYDPKAGFMMSWDRGIQTFKTIEELVASDPKFDPKNGLLNLEKSSP